MFNFGKKKPVPTYAFKERVPAQRATVKERGIESTEPKQKSKTQKYWPLLRKPKENRI